MSPEQVQVMVYAMAYNGGTVNNFACGSPSMDIPRRTRKSALELVNRTAKHLGLSEDGASSLRKIAEVSRKILANGVRCSGCNGTGMEPGTPYRCTVCNAGEPL